MSTSYIPADPATARWYRDRMPGMLSTAQAAAMAGTSRYTVDREIGRGNLAAEKVGGRYVIDPAEAERWAAAYKPYAALRLPRKPPPGSSPPLTP